jgi:hypothetical protein
LQIPEAGVLASNFFENVLSRNGNFDQVAVSDFIWPVTFSAMLRRCWAYDAGCRTMFLMIVLPRMHTCASSRKQALASFFTALFAAGMHQMILLLTKFAAQNT